MSTNNKYWGQYQDEDGEWKSIKCSTYKKLKKEDPTKWEHKQLFTRKIKGIRYKLHAKSNSNKFAFNPKQSPQQSTGGKMTTTHEFITETIANLKELNICIGNESILIESELILVEEKTTIYCPIQKKYIDYFPDLIVHFSSDKEYFKKWGGRFAIEINHTSSPSDTKRKHLQYIGLPLLELNVTDKIKYSFERQDVEDSVLDNYSDFLKNIFSNVIYLKQENSTFSNRYLGNYAYSLKQDIKSLKEDINVKDSNISELLLNFENYKSQVSSTINQYKSELGKQKQQIDIFQKDLENSNSIIEEFKSRSFFKRLLYLFGL